MEVITPQISNKSSLPGPLPSNQDVAYLDQRTQERNLEASSSRVDDTQITAKTYNYSQLKGLEYQESGLRISTKSQINRHPDSCLLCLAYLYLNRNSI